MADKRKFDGEEPVIEKKQKLDAEEVDFDNIAHEEWYMNDDQWRDSVAQQYTALGLKDRDIIELNVKLDEVNDSYRKLQEELDQSRNDDKLEELQEKISIMNKEMERNQKAALDKEGHLLRDLSTATELSRLYKRRSNTYAKRVREAKATIRALTTEEPTPEASLFNELQKQIMSKDEEVSSRASAAASACNMHKSVVDKVDQDLRIQFSRRLDLENRIASCSRTDIQEIDRLIEEFVAVIESCSQLSQKRLRTELVKERRIQELLATLKGADQ
ncbi:unnamed protein product [Linum trigynum]|uniref:Uncharacterized protein n=1 Tax=Linum trigynum TaxID=586398 RepID=A0AAV2CZY7_9ROSI